MRKDFFFRKWISPIWNSVTNRSMGVHSVGQGAWPPWIFKRGTNKVEGGLNGAIFCSCFSVALSPGNFSTNALEQKF